MKRFGISGFWRIQALILVVDVGDGGGGGAAVLAAAIVLVLVVVAGVVKVGTVFGCVVVGASGKA